MTDRYPRREDGKIDLLACSDEQINELKARLIRKLTKGEDPPLHATNS